MGLSYDVYDNLSADEIDRLLRLDNYIKEYEEDLSDRQERKMD
jgi:hypothetical protein